MFVWMDMGHVQISWKPNFQIYVDENWAHRIPENIEFPRLFGWKSGTPDFRKTESPKLLV